MEMIWQDFKNWSWVCIHFLAAIISIYLKGTSGISTSLIERMCENFSWVGVLMKWYLFYNSLELISGEQPNLCEMPWGISYAPLSTHCGLVMPLMASNTAWSPLVHVRACFLNHWQFADSWTLRNEFHWIFSWNTDIICHESTFENAAFCLGLIVLTQLTIWTKWRETWTQRKTFLKYFQMLFINNHLASCWRQPLIL